MYSIIEFDKLSDGSMRATYVLSPGASRDEAVENYLIMKYDLGHERMSDFVFITRHPESAGYVTGWHDATIVAEAVENLLQTLRDGPYRDPLFIRYKEWCHVYQAKLQQRFY